MRSLKGLLVGWILILGLTPDLRAFSLLGPHAAWMTTNMSYSLESGPMKINEGYRWNVPTLTYGFDPSFVAAFGQPGMDAVEAAIQIFNDLPAASQIDLANYAFTTEHVNPLASSQHLLDLKSYALVQLIGQLGLASPSRYINTFRSLQFTNNQTNYTVIQRNFDPQTLQATNMCNGYAYDSTIYFYPVRNFGFVQNYVIDPFGTPSAVADGPSNNGEYYSALTFDDAGGLRFLLNQSNHVVESLPPDCNGVGNALIDGVLRPGREELTFVRMEWNVTNQQFTPMTNVFTDYYFSPTPPGNTNLQQQTVQRIITRPDFVFRAQEAIPVLAYFQGKPFLLSSGLGTTTDASFWQKNAEANGNPGGDGPGVIQGPIDITLYDFSRFIAAAGSNRGPEYPDIPFRNSFDLLQWGSFAGTANIVSFNSGPTNLISTTIRTALSPAGTFEWILLANVNGVYRIDSSTNMLDWDPKLTFTNSFGIFTYTNQTATGNEFYRAVKVGQE